MRSRLGAGTTNTIAAASATDVAMSFSRSTRASGQVVTRPASAMLRSMRARDAGVATPRSARGRASGSVVAAAPGARPGTGWSNRRGSTPARAGTRP